MLVLAAYGLLLLLHRSFFVGLFGAGGVFVGQALGTRGRYGRPMTGITKVAIAAGIFVIFMLSGLLLQVAGLLPR